MNTASIEDSTELDEILMNTDLDRISYSPMEEQHDESEELLGVVTGPANDTNASTSDMALRDGAYRELRTGLDSRPGSSPSFPQLGDHSVVTARYMHV